MKWNSQNCVQNGHCHNRKIYMTVAAIPKVFELRLYTKYEYITARGHLGSHVQETGLPHLCP